MVYYEGYNAARTLCFYDQTCVDLALLLVQGHLNQTGAYGVQSVQILFIRYFDMTIILQNRKGPISTQQLSSNIHLSDFEDMPIMLKN